MPKSWLPPAVWCQGDQSTRTGGSSSKYANCETSIAWFEHHMRWVLITAFGVPVEPEVNRNLTMVSGPTLAFAASASVVGAGASQVCNSVAGRLASGLRSTTTSTPGGTTASIARRYG